MMHRQRGVIATIWLITAGGIALTIVGLGIAVKVQSARLESCKEAAAAFQAQVKAQGEAAAKEAARVNRVNQTALEAANNEYAKTKTDLASTYAAYRKLRNDNAGSRTMSSSTPITGGTDRTCYRSGDITKSVDDLEKSVFGEFDLLDAAVPSVLEQGDIARTRLQGAMKWATSLAR